MSRKEDFLKKAGIDCVSSVEHLSQIASYYDDSTLEEPEMRTLFFPSGNNRVGLMSAPLHVNPDSLSFKSKEAALEFKKDFEQEIFKYLW